MTTTTRNPRRKAAPNGKADPRPPRPATRARRATVHQAPRPKGRHRRSGQPGPTGFHPLRQGKDRRSYVVPIGRKGVGGSIGLFATSTAEFIAALIALLHHTILEIGRGDVSDAAADSLHITGPFGHRVQIRYVFEGKTHWYLPDYVARTADGRPIVIEAGIGARKGTPQELAKLAAAKAWAEAQGGELWVIAADLVPPRWVRGALSLYLSRLGYQGDAVLLAAVRAAWDAEPLSLADLCRRFGDHGREQVVAAARKAAGDLLEEGRLDVELARTVITFTTKIGARQEGDRVEPPGIVRDLSVLAAMAEAADPSSLPEDTDPADRPDIDADTIIDPGMRSEFLARRSAMADILGGMPAAAAARRHDLEPRRTQQLAVAYRKHGERALLPYGVTASPESSMPEEVQDRIGALYRKSRRPSIAAIVDDKGLRLLAADKGMRMSPTRYQVTKVVNKLLASDQKTREARAGRKLVPLTVTGRAVTTEYVPGTRVEFDEATLDVKVLALAGLSTTIRLHIGLLIDVATRYPLSVVVSPKALDQWDLRRALLRALLPDDDFRARFGIRRPSPWH